MKNTSHSKLKILADENIPFKILRVLADEGLDITRVVPRSTDKQVFEFSKSEGRTILTFDRHFLNKEKFPPRESSGIIFLGINPPLADQIVISLNKLFSSARASEFRGRLFSVFLSGFRVWPKDI